MSWIPFLIPEAQADFERMPTPVQEAVARHLLTLSSDPVGLSRPSRVPNEPPKMQAYDCQAHIDGKHYFFTIYFRYELDEVHLRVTAIWHEQRDW